MKKISLTYDDIQLVPRHSTVSSRKDISLATPLSKRYKIDIPIVASPMDTVCETNMAIKMMDLGGVGCIHRFCGMIEQAEMVSKVAIHKYSNNYDSDKKLNPYYRPVMAAIGVSKRDKDRAKMLVDAGCEVLLIDVAHGDHENVIQMIKWCKKKFTKKDVDIIAGNIATSEAAERLQDAGVDGLRVGIGGGSLCTTRMRTGFGVPNVTCLEEIQKVAKVPIMADGGIRSSGDMAKALAVGAQNVMIGSLIAGTDESPGRILESPSGLYKRYRGSASLETKMAHNQEERNVEGESATIPYKGGVKFVIKDLCDGIRSALSYAGATHLTTYFPEYVEVTNSGLTEAKPHLL